MSQLTKADIEHLAALARIEISEEEKDELAGRLGSVLRYVSEIAKIATETGATPVPGELRNVLRDDTNARAGGEFTDAILANAPKVEDGYIKVKRIL